MHQNIRSNEPSGDIAPVTTEAQKLNQTGEFGLQNLPKFDFGLLERIFIGMMVVGTLCATTGCDSESKESKAESIQRMELKKTFALANPDLISTLLIKESQMPVDSWGVRGIRNQETWGILALGSKAEPALLEALQSTNSRMRYIASILLGESNSSNPAMITGLRHCLRDVHTAVRREAANSLRKLNWSPSNENEKGMFIVAQQRRPVHRASEVNPYFYVEPSIKGTVLAEPTVCLPYLLSDLKLNEDNQYSPRENAMSFLSLLGQTGASPVLLEILKSPRSSDRCWALGALESLVPPYFRHDGQCVLDASRAISVVSNCIEDSNPDVRYAAIHYLSHVAMRYDGLKWQVTEAMKPAFTHSDIEVRKMAKWFMESLMFKSYGGRFVAHFPGHFSSAHYPTEHYSYLHPGHNTAQRRLVEDANIPSPTPEESKSIARLISAVSNRANIPWDPILRKDSDGHKQLHLLPEVKELIDYGPKAVPQIIDALRTAGAESVQRRNLSYVLANSSPACDQSYNILINRAESGDSLALGLLIDFRPVTTRTKNLFQETISRIEGL